jgi:hypothetical protein
MLGRFDVNHRTVLRYECLQDLVVRLALGDMLINFLQHALSGFAWSRKRSTRMRAAASRHIATLAHALDLHAKLACMIGLRREPYSDKRANGQAEKENE